MNSVMAMDMQTRRMAGVAALVATMFSMSGTLTLAEHYARTGQHGQDYVAGNPAVRYAAPVASRHAQDGKAVTRS